jgi:hypothetical protein
MRPRVDPWFVRELIGNRLTDAILKSLEDAAMSCPALKEIGLEGNELNIRSFDKLLTLVKHPSLAQLRLVLLQLISCNRGLLTRVCFYDSKV